MKKEVSSVSQTFIMVWCKHFNNNKNPYSFNFINEVSFVKSSILPLYINVGKNLTKGISYILNSFSTIKDYKNKVFLIYDVTPQLNEITNDSSINIAVLKSNQYPGFLINLSAFKDIDDYLLNTFSKNSRMKMRKFTKRLDECFNISTKMFFGDIDKNEYDSIFEYFMILLQKRYLEKQISNNNMLASEWDFYKEVAYPLILEKKASLFVIYDNKTPINITFNYHTDDRLIDAITVFDTDYSKFNIGYVNNLKILEWCFENNLKIMDFSKGYFDYKKRMCTLEYNFEYHILYDKESIKSKLIAYSYYTFFELKSYLRSKNLNLILHKLTYLIKNMKRSSLKKDFEIIEIDCLPDIEGLLKIDVKNNSNYSFLNKITNDFLYLVVQPYDKIQVFKKINQDNEYFFSSNSLIQKVKFFK